MSEDKELERIKKEMMKKILSRDLATEKSQTILIEDRVTVLNESTFEKAINETSKPILIDFWAEWCAPCRIMSPIIEKMARDYKGKAFFAKLNVDKNHNLARKFGVMSIPNFLIFKNGKAVDRIIGAGGRQRLEVKLRHYL